MSDLHLVRLSVDSQRLYAFARRSGLPARDFDEGYALHAFFAALFDHGAPEDARVAPKPFRLMDPSKRALEVFGYTSLDHRGLAERAERFADPAAWGVCDLERATSKPMPSEFPVGTRLGFSVRVCPIRRIAKKGPMERERAEVDAFLARSWEVGPDVPLDRAEVYSEWLREEVAKGGARVEGAAVERFQLDRLHRRTHGSARRGHRSGRPDVTFEGTLEVTDTAAFGARLARGLGRHRAFGFGMLLLRPPSRA